MTVLTVVGAGSMGAQIAQQAALHGLDVRLHDQSDEQLRKATESNRGHLIRRVERGKLGRGEMESALARVHPTTALEAAVSGADFIIEAVFEDLKVKREIFSDLDRLSAPDAVLASNSSTMGISKIAGATARPERCVNMHFFYPVLVMDLIEIVRGRETSDETVARAMDVAREMGRTPVLINKEIDGFIVNRILHAATQEAYRLLDAEWQPSRTSIQPSRKASTGHSGRSVSGTSAASTSPTTPGSTCTRRPAMTATDRLLNWKQRSRPGSLAGRLAKGGIDTTAERMPVVD